MSIPEKRFIACHDEVGLTESISVTVNYVPHRPWHDKWREVVACYDALRAAYEGKLSVADSTAYRKLVTDFSDACLEVRDHLFADPATGVSKEEATAVITDGRYLPIARDISNVDKHHTATQRGTLPAHVSGITMPEDRRVSMEVTHQRPGASSPVDALDLADGASAEWVTFFQSHGLTPE